MVELGYFCLILSFMLAAYSVVTSFIGAYNQHASSTAVSSQRALICIFPVISIASFSLFWLLGTKNLQVEYVAMYISKSLPLMYTLSAFWAGQAGSLLLWAWFLSLITFIAALTINRTFNIDRSTILYSYHVLALIILFFVGLLVFVTNPFKLLPFIPQDGAGLNFQLQHPVMIIHPPSLYIGYICCSIPFALAMGALLSKRLKSDWFKAARFWSVIAWIFLTAGNILGANWAYETLGWGGFWAWDPVENAGLLPWLTLTAFLHTGIAQEKRNMLKTWNLCLIVLTFALTIFGTFLTRSGILSSVHAFVESAIFTFTFFIFLTLILSCGFFLILYRKSLLKPASQIDSVLSREGALLFSSLVLVAITFTTLWGTLFPVISEVIIKEKIHVGPVFFNKVNGPTSLVLLALIGIGSLIDWQQKTYLNKLKSLLAPLSMGVLLVAVLVLVGMNSLFALLGFGLISFVLIAILIKIGSEIVIKKQLEKMGIIQALKIQLMTNHRKFGSYIVHIGVILFFLGILGQVFHRDYEVHLQKGDTASFAGYTFSFRGLTFKEKPSRFIISSLLYVTKQDKFIGSMTPKKIFLKESKDPITSMAIKSNIRDDLYVVLAGYDFKNQTGIFQMYLNPLTLWLWLGGFIMMFGGIYAVLPDKKAVSIKESYEKLNA